MILIIDEKIRANPSSWGLEGSVITAELLSDETYGALALNIPHHAYFGCEALRKSSGISPTSLY